MDTEDRKWIAKEIEKREAQFRPDADRYNTNEVREEETLYHKILNADLRIAPKKGQTYEAYLIELKIHIENARRKNYQVHVIKGIRGRPWYTHTRGDGCFMCEDINLISVMYQTMALMAQKNPKKIF